MNIRRLTAVLIFLLPAALAGLQVSAKEVPKISANEPYSISYCAGGHDSAGNFMGGTESMNLVPYKGKLYAGIGYWMDRPKMIPNHSDPKSGAQILVLDSKNSKWRQEAAFNQKDNSGDTTTLKYHRLSTMNVLQFHKFDASGKPVGVIDQLLVAGLDSPGGAVFSQLTPGKWEDTRLPTDSPIRSLEVHYDRIDKTEKIFAGTGGGQERDVDRGIFCGVYDTAAPGKIRWNATPEPFGLQSRVMSMVDCDGTLLAAAKPSILKRNDSTKQWETIYSHSSTNSYDQSKYTSGFRGLTCLNSSAVKNEILSGFEGVSGEICRINRQTGAAELELKTRQFLAAQWGAPPAKRDIITGYNDIPVVRKGSEERHLFGLLTRSPKPAEENSAWILSRSSSQPPHYQLHEVKALKWPNVRSDELLWSVRTIAVSPFPEDHGEVIYLGGYDGHFKPDHNTAWIYRVGLNTALQPYKK